MSNFFDTLSNAGIDILIFARDTAESLVESFISPIGELSPLLAGTTLGDYSLLAIMAGVGLPLYVIFTTVKYIVGIIT